MPNLNQHAPLRFITAGSVDDGKSTLIGRLLYDSKALLGDQLRQIEAAGSAPDFSALTDGLEAEREQGITIDVAYRYFSTARRKYIIADTPGHEQYTRNMVTGASTAHAAVLLLDASQLDYRQTPLQLLPQTKRHSAILHHLRCPHIIVAINTIFDSPSEPIVQNTMPCISSTAAIDIRNIIDDDATKLIITPVRSILFMSNAPLRMLKV